MKKENQTFDGDSGIWIVIPAYNEETVLGKILTNLCANEYSIVVVDDCSTDSTCEVAINFPVVVLRHTINLGQGAALQTGFDYVLQKTNASCIVTFDSDGQHCEEEIPLLTKPILSGDFDVALGSRFFGKSKRGKDLTGIPFSKLITLKLGVFFTLITTRLKVSDTHNGFRAFSRNALNKLHITQNRMAHGSEILSQIAVNKLRYCEVPVTIAYTEYSKKKGQSIFNSINILWDLFFGGDK